MNIIISFDIVGPKISFNEAISIIDKAGESLFYGYKEANKKHDAAKLWQIDIKNYDMIEKARLELKKYLYDDVFVQERILPNAIKYDQSNHEWFILFKFADDASRAEITHHTDSEITCKTCGNKQQNPRFVPAIKPSKLPVRPKLMSFYAPLKIFCRPKFIKQYEKAGLTGLTFIEWNEKDKHGQPLTLIKVTRHQWQDRAGVCDACEMKTNVTNTCGFFNTHDQFQYDIQYVNTYEVQTFVLSRKAIEFFRGTTEFTKIVLEDTPSIYPIIPGYLEDIVWPEPKLFAHGKIPLHMLRSSWEKK